MSGYGRQINEPLFCVELVFVLLAEGGKGERKGRPIRLDWMDVRVQSH